MKTSTKRLSLVRNDETPAPAILLTRTIRDAGDAAIVRPDLEPPAELAGHPMSFETAVAFLRIRRRRALDELAAGRPREWSPIELYAVGVALLELELEL